MPRKILKKIVYAAVISGIIIIPGVTDVLAASANPESNPVERIVEESSGRVEIDIPDNILDELLRDDQPKHTTKSQKNSLKPGINKVVGYRIQVFSDGSRQSSLESRARARGNAVVAKFPKYRGQVYAYSSSPNWYTRIGNFRTSQEASAALAELKGAFPQFANEMRIVKSQIVVIK
ncbi:MAG: SPOR domain-containing protein [Bacteroidales bacterium]|nr:SPOR domain-containing protein [Bacteroidales bacterium]MBD5206559.1 SPOR domain-containing protein [Bacteroidales bacterium]MBD5224109.1 SPOR domain-containing protein [Bacteroidales bacterium]